jgi:adenosylcobinamide-GDP ribazoletransferase
MRSALSFLTAAGGSRPPGPGTLDWFPAVGLLIGSVLGVIWWAADQIWPAAVSAAVVVAADLAITGLLHLDGLIDSGDGLIAPMDRERRLAVMAAPDAGAFGVGVAIVVVLLRWVALASSAHGSLDRDVALLAALWCASRTLAAAIARWRPYARRRGLASAFAGRRRPVITAVGLSVAAALALVWRPGAGGAAVGAAVLMGGLTQMLAERRLGGYTGDVLGATVLLSETAGLITVAAKW